MKIGIIGALEEEINELKKKINHIKTLPWATSAIKGKINDKEIIVVQSGVGKVSAAISTTTLILTENPDYIINTGTAGGLSKKLNINDIVISTEVRHYDVDCTAFEYDIGQMVSMPPFFEPDKKLLHKTEAVAKKYISDKYHKGLIASGDSFVSRKETIETIKKNFPDILAVEMEASAIAQTCYIFQKPFIVIRAISDIPEKENNEKTFDEFLKEAGDTSANLIINLINEL